MVKLKVVGRIMDYLRDDSSSQVALLVMLLANVTTSESACLDLLQLDNGALAGLNMYALSLYVLQYAHMWVCRDQCMPLHKLITAPTCSAQSYALLFCPALI